MSAPIGIDLGTSQCCVCALQGDAFVTIPSQHGGALTPSWVAFQPGGVITGQAAERYAMRSPESGVLGLKRLLGRKFHAPETGWLRQALTVPVVPAVNGDAWLRVGGLDRSPQEVLSYLLEDLRLQAEAALGTSVDAAVLSVPASYTEPQRRAVIAAARLAGLEVSHLLQAPTAAALGYAELWPEEHGRWAVLSLGAGCYDVAIVEVDGPAFTVRSVAGDALLGGDDFNRRIVDHLLEGFYADHGVDLIESPSATLRVFQAARAAKHQLSRGPRSAPIELLNVAVRDGEPLSLRAPGIDRALFEQLVGEELDRLSDPCAWALQDVGLGTDDLDAVIVAGGMGRMPLAVNRVSYLFRSRPRRVAEPEQLCALGAAVYASALASTHAELQVTDIAPHSLGIKVRDGRFNPVISRNRVMPCSERKVFAPARPDQRQMVFEIFQGEAELVNDNTYLGRFVLDVAAPLQPVVVTFGLDADGLVALHDERAGAAAPVIQAASGLSEEQLHELAAARADRACAVTVAAGPASYPPILSPRPPALRPNEPEHSGRPPPVGRSMPPHGRAVNPAMLKTAFPDGEREPLPRGVAPARARPDAITRPRDSLAGRPIEVAGDSLVGTVLGGRYIIDDIIAEGGMGRVYLATHEVLNKRFAIKVLHAELANNEDLAARFVREAQAAATIDSQHVVVISDFGRLDDGTGYFVMEYLEGRTLAHLIRDRGALGADLIVKIVTQLASGLSAAHARGIVHRDLKPDNVTIVQREGNPYFCKILDFGIAKAPTSDSGERHTLAGTLLGTPHYMAPEQIDGDDVDARSDIYALGAVMYEMATGRPPFQADSIVSVLVMHKCDVPVPVRERPVGASCPPALEAVIMRCLEKRPDDRFSSAANLLDALRTLPA